MPQYYANEAVMINTLSHMLEQAIEKTGHPPKVLVIGPNGRTGIGATELFDAFSRQNVEVIGWGRKETEKGGPFPEILSDFDIMCNCIFNDKPINPFLTEELVQNHGGTVRLKVIADITNDIGPGNPIFGITQSTNLENPTVRVAGIDVIEVDNLPSHVPHRSSEEFSSQLLPYLQQLLARTRSLGEEAVQPDPDVDGVWNRATKLFVRHSDIPSVGRELGQELVQAWAGNNNALQSELLRFLEKNPLSKVEQETFQIYLLEGAKEAGAPQNMIEALQHLDIKALHNTPEMQRQHALLEEIYDFKRSADFSTDIRKNEKAEDAFYALCDATSQAINNPGMSNRVTEAKTAFLSCLSETAQQNPHLQKRLGDIQNKAGLSNIR